MFLALAYFGCDQSQVQRYLAGRSIAQSRLGLLFNAVAKIPMQAFILFIGAMVFVLFLFVKPPAIFQPVEADRAAQSPAWTQVEKQYDEAFAARRAAAMRLAQSIRTGADRSEELATFHQAEARFAAARKNALGVVDRVEHTKGFNDTNYIFLDLCDEISSGWRRGPADRRNFHRRRCLPVPARSILSRRSASSISTNGSQFATQATGITSGYRGCSRCSGRRMPLYSPIRHAALAR